MALLATDRFVALARAQARALGSEDLPLIVVEHPIGGLDEVELRGRSETAADHALRWFDELLARREPGRAGG